MEVEEEQNKVSMLVEHCLHFDERCRNNDLWLILWVWRMQGIKIYVDYKKLDMMITPESITRCRRKIQETRLKPTDEKVIRKRTKREKEFKEYYSIR